MARTQLTVSSFLSLDEDTQAFLAQKAGEVKSRMQRSALDVLAIGTALLEVKARIGHGSFLRWIESEFSMSDRTARRFMAVAERFGGKTDTVTVLPVSVLYLLSSGKVSDEEAEQVIAGEIPVSSLRQKPRQDSDGFISSESALKAVVDILCWFWEQTGEKEGENQQQSLELLFAVFLQHEPVNAADQEEYADFLLALSDAAARIGSNYREMTLDGEPIAKD